MAHLILYGLYSGRSFLYILSRGVKYSTLPLIGTLNKWDARYVVHFFSAPWIFLPFSGKKTSDKWFFSVLLGDKLRLSGTCNGTTSFFFENEVIPSQNL